MGARLSAHTTVAALLPAIIALLLLGAHFLRSGHMVLVVACLGLSALVVVRRGWALRVLQAALGLGALEWLRSAWLFASQRVALGQPYGRLLLILGGVAIFTAAAALLLQTAAARRHFDSGR